MCARQHARPIGEGVAGRNVPLRRVAEDATAAADREERRSTLQTVAVALRVRSEFRYCRNELDLLYMHPTHLLRIVYFDRAKRGSTLPYSVS